MISLSDNWYQKKLPYPVPKTSYTILKCLRFLTNRRLTVLAQLNQNNIIIKFFSKSSECLREKQNYQTLKKTGLSLAHLRCELSATSLIYDYLVATQNWSELTKQERAHYFLQLISILRTLHRFNCLHQDLHPGNFLINEKKIFLLDYTAFKKILFFKNIRKFFNLGECLSQIYLKDTTNLNCYIDHYFEKKINSKKNVLKKCLHKLAHYYCLKKIKRYQKKIMRTCSEFISTRKKNFFQVLRRDLNWDPELDPATLPIKAYLKRGNTATVWLSTWQNKTIVVKRYHQKTILGSFCHRFKKSRAYLSWCNGYRLLQSGLPTPYPFLFREEYSYLGLKRAYYITEYIESMPTETFLSIYPKSTQLQQSFEKTFNHMYLLKICQLDTKANNFLIYQNVPYLIDLDNLRFYRSTLFFKRAWKKSWFRWLRNYKKLA